MDWNSIPHAGNAPPGSPRSKIVAPAGWSRRTALKAAAATGVGLAMASVGMLSRARVTEAAKWEQWLDCSPNEYFKANTICTSGYYGADNNWNSWHKDWTETFACNGVPGNVIHIYVQLGNSCAGKNAWRWTQSGTTTKCSDGTKNYTNHCTGEQTGYGSIARTTL